MKTPTEQEAAFMRLNVTDLDELKFLRAELDLLQVADVTIDNLHKIENVCRSLQSFREKYSIRVINLLKKGYLSD